MRSRWRRSFALLAAVVIFTGAASVIGIVLVVDSFRGSAVAVEQEATASAQLRNAIVAGVITFSSPSSGSQQTAEAAAVEAIGVGYATDLRKMRSTAARTLLTVSLVKWNALLAAGAPRGQLASQAVRGDVVTTQTPEVLSLLDQAASVNRAAVRADLAHATRLDREVWHYSSSSNSWRLPSRCGRHNSCQKKFCARWGSCVIRRIGSHVGNSTTAS